MISIDKLSQQNNDLGHVASSVHDSSSENETETNAKSDTPLTQAGSRTVLEQACRDLIVMREGRGASTPPGYRCSNSVELLQTPPHPAHQIKYFTKEGEVYFRNRRTDNLEQQTGDLQRLLAAGE